MKDCVGINRAHLRPFSLNINNVKHELAKSVNSYCDPTRNLYLGLQKCVSWCQVWAHTPDDDYLLWALLGHVPHFQKIIETEAWAVEVDSLHVGLYLTDFLIYDVLGMNGSCMRRVWLIILKRSNDCL